MDYSMNVRSQPVDCPVHRELGGWVSLVSAKLASINVHEDEHLLGHSSLADHSRGCDDGAVVEARADIAVGCGNEAALVDLPAYLNDLLPEFSLVLH